MCSVDHLEPEGLIENVFEFDDEFHLQTLFHYVPNILFAFNRLLVKVLD